MADKTQDKTMEVTKDSVQFAIKFAFEHTKRIGELAKLLDTSIQTINKLTDSKRTDLSEQEKAVGNAINALRVNNMLGAAALYFVGDDTVATIKAMWPERTRTVSITAAMVKRYYAKRNNGDSGTDATNLADVLRELGEKLHMSEDKLTTTVIEYYALSDAMSKALAMGDYAKVAELAQRQTA